MPASQLKNLKASVKENDARVGKGQKHTKKNEGVTKIREAFNPFDVKSTRQKHSVLGHTAQGTKGLPSLRKKEGEEERRQAYMANVRMRNKAGGLRDRRFGENDRSMSNEDKMMARFTKERQSKASMYNLEDQMSVFGGYGDSLALEDELMSGMEPGADFEDDDLMQVKTNASGAANEGDEEEAGEGAPAKKKTKKEVMNEVIAKSKMHKHMRQQAQENYLEEVQNLDDSQNMQDLVQEITGASNTNKQDKSNVPQPQPSVDFGISGNDDSHYEKTLRELNFDRRAVPADRSKTEEELEREKREQRANLEREREMRMNPQDVAEDDDRNVASSFGLPSLVDNSSDDDFEDVINEEHLHESDAEDGEEGNMLSRTHKRLPGSNLPKDRQELKKLLAGVSPSEQLAAAKNALHENRPSLRAGNKEAQNVFICVMVDYLVGDLAGNVKDGETVFNEWVQCIKSVAEENEATSSLAQHFQTRLHKLSNKIQKAQFRLTLADLLFLGVIPVIFSSSDHYHLVCLPSSILIGQYLSQSVVKTLQDLCTKLFLCEVLLSYQRIAHRFIPEVVACLQTAILRLTDSRFKDHKLKLNKDGVEFNVENLPSSISDDGEIDLRRVLESGGDTKTLGRELGRVCLSLVTRYASLWKDTAAFAEAFRPMVSALERCSSQSVVVKDVFDRLGRLLRFSAADKAPLTLQDHRPIPIVSHAPEFEVNYNPERKSYTGGDTSKELNKLKKEMKEEKKSTLKELRRDAAFTSREQIKEKRAEYKQYHADIARLENQIQTEEGAEKNKYERERAARKRKHK